MNKYHAKKCVIDGISFDSRREARRYTELKTLRQAGEISALKLQEPFELVPKQRGERAVTYRADFVYMEGGALVVEDVKGMKTKDYIIKRKLFKWRYPNIEFREVK